MQSYTCLLDEAGPHCINPRLLSGKTENQSMQVTSGVLPTSFCNARYRADAEDSVNIWRSETFAGAAAEVGGQSIRHIN